MSDISPQTDAHLRRRGAPFPSAVPDDNGSHDTHESTDTPPQYSLFPELTSRWRLKRDDASLAIRLLMRFVELILTSLAMLLLPTLIHHLATYIDTIYEFLGRRAKSPFEPIPWVSITAGSVIYLVWHACLIKVAVMRNQVDDALEKKEKESITEGGETRDGITKMPNWYRETARVLMPGYIVSCAGVWIVVMVLEISRHALKEKKDK